jgi:hypothetical protein
MFDNIEENK